MAVGSIGECGYEFTAPNDELLEKVRVKAFAAFTGDNAGQVAAVVNIIRVQPNGVIVLDATDESTCWQSGAMNANAMVTDPADIGWVYGIRAVMPADARLVVYIE